MYKLPKTVLAFGMVTI